MAVYQVKVSLKHKKNTKLMWLASDRNFKLLHNGCPIAHGNPRIYFGVLEVPTIPMSPGNILHGLFNDSEFFISLVKNDLLLDMSLYKRFCKMESKT